MGNCVFLEIFQKPPSRPSKPLSDSCHFQCIFGFLVRTTWRHELVARRHNLAHPVFWVLIEQSGGDEHSPGNASWLTQFWYFGGLWVILIEEKGLILVDGMIGCQQLSNFHVIGINLMKLVWRDFRLGKLGIYEFTSIWCMNYVKDYMLALKWIFSNFGTRIALLNCRIRHRNEFWDFKVLASATDSGIFPRTDVPPSRM